MLPRLLPAVLAGVARRETPVASSRWRKAAAAFFCLALLPVELPADAGQFAYHIRKTHFVSSLFVSFSDLRRLAAPDPLHAPARIGDPDADMARMKRGQGKGIDAGEHDPTLGTKEERGKRADHPIFVIPAKAGTQSVRRLTPHWVPAFAGMTMVG